MIVPRRENPIAARPVIALFLGVVLGCESPEPVGVVERVPAQLSISAGNDQVGAVVAELDTDPQVKVTDSGGVGVPGIMVNFVVTAGGGDAIGPVAITDEEGLASTPWRLGTVSGQSQELRGVFRRSDDGVTMSVVFEATSVAGDPVSLKRHSGNTQRGAEGFPLASPLVVVVRDDWGNPVPGADVSWRVATGRGTVSAPSTSTDNEGLASVVWTLGEVDAPQAVDAVLAELPAVRFTAESGLPSYIDELPAMPGPVRAPAAAASDDQLFVIGGTAGQDRTPLLQIFDFEAETWALGADAPVAMDWASAAFVEGALHVFGGVTNSLATTDEHYVYDPVLDSWTEGARLPVSAAGAAVVQVGSLVYLFGGLDLPGAESAHTRIYDATTDSWTVGSPSPRPRITWAGGALPDGRILVGGGENLRVNWDEVWAYDPAADSWEALPSMAIAREAHGAAVVDGKFCVFGGRQRDSVECYDPDDNEWAYGVTLPGVIAELVAVTAGDAVYLVGGRDYGDAGKLLRFRLD